MLSANLASDIPHSHFNLVLIITHNFSIINSFSTHSIPPFGLKFHTLALLGMLNIFLNRKTASHGKIT